MAFSVGILSKLSNFFLRSDMLQRYYALVHPFFVLWYNNLGSHLSHYTYIFKRLKSLLYQAIRAVAKCYYRDEVKTCIHLTILQVDDLLSEIAKFVHCFVTNVLIDSYFCKTVEHSGTRQPDATELTRDNSQRESWGQDILTSKALNFRDFHFTFLFRDTLFFKTVNTRLLWH